MAYNLPKILSLFPNSLFNPRRVFPVRFSFPLWYLTQYFIQFHLGCWLNILLFGTFGTLDEGLSQTSSLSQSMTALSAAVPSRTVYKLYLFYFFIIPLLSRTLRQNNKLTNKLTC